MAQQPTHVPKFGNWDSEENIPYTAVFDSARTVKGVGGKMINPNDPEENPAAFAHSVNESDHAAQQPPRKKYELQSFPPDKLSPTLPRTPVGAESNGVLVTKPRHERRISREDIEVKRQIESPAHSQYADAASRKTVGESAGHRYSGRSTTTGGPLISKTDSQRRRPYSNQENSGSDRGGGEHFHGVDQSPSHHYHGRLGNKPAAGSLGLEKKVSTEGGTVFAPGTPGRSKVRGGNNRADETPDRNAALPKFGAWNENDPASADGFTFIFNKAREEKQTSTAKFPTIHSDTASYDSGHKQSNISRSKSAVCCCFAPKAVE
eukprot:Gb_02314 [translate_table: standard]